MSRFKQVYTPVDEGWGAVLSRLASFVLPTPINMVKCVASNAILKELINDKDLKKYLKTQCDRIYKQERKTDSSITPQLPSDPITMAKTWLHKKDGIDTLSKTNLMHESNGLIDDKIFNLRISNYAITFFYDTDHIDAAVLLLYSKDRDTVIGRRIAAPTSGELTNKFKQE